MMFKRSGTMDLKQYRHYHFIGIGGMSMSGLAEMLNARGAEVSGSDRTDGPMLDKLRSEGIRCYVGHEASQVHGADAVVYTAAIPKDNCELREAERLGIPLIYRGDLLGAWMHEYPVSIGVCGTHGKSTCTSMCATILLGAGKDPGVHIGTELDLIGGTTRVGEGSVFVAESCEYQDSFLDLFPTVAVVLNIEEDHLDYFSGIDQIRDSFVRFIRICPEDSGLAVLNGDDPQTMRAGKEAGRRYVTFGLGEVCDYRADEIVLENGKYSYTLFRKGERVTRVSLSVPGRHHIYNSLAAIAACEACGVPAEEAAEHVKEYHGAARRFDDGGFCGGARIVHDYAHHPTEIRATLSAARDNAQGQVWCVFQPHTYTRTKQLFDSFAKAFSDSDHLLLADIYAAREPDPGDISSAMLAEAVKNQGHPDSRYGGSMEAIADTLKKETKPGDLILILGAGDIIRILPMLNGEKKA